MSGVVVRDLHKAYGSQPVLQGLDLAVAPHAITAVLGASGVGKTTVLRILAGFERPDRGYVEVGGRAVDGGGAFVPPERRRIGYVPQDGALFPHLTVAANVGFGLGRQGRAERVRSLLSAVDLDGLGARFPHELSGGQQQRVALARALAVEPAVMLLDEPFAALDAKLRASVRTEVRDILRRAGTTAILVTHDQDEALSLADTVAVMRDGRIAQAAAPAELYALPADADLARFVGDANLLPGTFDGAAVSTALGRAEVAADDVGRLPPGPVTALLRPEALEVCASRSEGGFRGRVIDVTYHGAESLVRIASTGAAAVEPILVRTFGSAGVRVGDEVTVVIRTPAVHVLPP